METARRERAAEMARGEIKGALADLESARAKLAAVGQRLLAGPVHQRGSGGAYTWGHWVGDTSNYAAETVAQLQASLRRDLGYRDRDLVRMARCEARLSAAAAKRNAKNAAAEAVKARLMSGMEAAFARLEENLSGIIGAARR